MKINTILYFFCFMLSFSTISYCQNFWHNTFLTGGIALSEQDRRLFDFPNQEEIIEKEVTNLDYEYNIFLQKKAITFKKFQTTLGIGYSAFNTTFSRPYDHSELNGGDDKFLRFIKRYTINKLIFPISNTLYLNKNQSIFINLNALPAFSFRKSIKFPPQRHTKWELELNSLELYPGAGVKISPRMQLAAHYRLIYIYKIDEVIFNNILFYQKDPEFLQKEYDNYNLFKIWITVSYALSNK